MLCLTLFCCFCFAAEAEAAKKQYPSFAIMYHKISNATDKSNPYIISPDAFESDIKKLCSLGYKFCTAEEYNRELKKNPTGLVLITFDDGYESDFTEALPILEKYNARAVFFVIGSKIGQPEYMSEEQLLKLSSSNAAQIGNHFFDVHDLPYEKLKNLYFSNSNYIFGDMEKNRTYLEDILKTKINAVSYPYGLYGKYFEYLVKSKGFISFSSEERSTYSASSPHGRYTRTPDMSAEKIIRKLQGKSILYTCK